MFQAFVILDGALAFFTFNDLGMGKCHVLDSSGSDRVIIVEKGEWHAMTAAPPSLGYPGHAVIFETSGHTFDTSKATKVIPHNSSFLKLKYYRRFWHPLPLYMEMVWMVIPSTLPIYSNSAPRNQIKFTRTEQIKDVVLLCN